MNNSLSGCGQDIYSALYAKYQLEKWNFATFRWFSTTHAKPFAFADNPDTITGWLDDLELEKLGNSIAITGATTIKDILTTPYGNNLRPLDDISIIKNSSEIIVSQVVFIPFDVTKLASLEQNATANQAIRDSLLVNYEAYAQTRFLNTVPTTWQQNFFRPKIEFSGTKLIQSYERTYDYGNSLVHRGDFGFGEVLPFSMNTPKLIENIGDDVNISIKAICGQIIQDGVDFYLKRYPLMCRMEMFWH